MTTRSHTWRPRHPKQLVAIGGLVAVFALGGSGHTSKAYGADALHRPGTNALGVALTAAHASGSTSTASTTTPITSGSSSGSSGEGPPGIQAGPGNTTAPSTPDAGSGGAVSGGSQPSPGLFDITGHIEAAIDSWFRDLVTAALDPILTLLGHTLLATPNVTAQRLSCGYRTLTVLFTVT
jgi:hypothetical protein